jgi:hypothetical protein
MGARNRVRIRLLYRPARLHRSAESILWNWFLGSLKVQKSGSVLRGAWWRRKGKNRGQIQWKAWCMGPYMPELTVYNITICPIQCRLRLIYHGQPYARVDFIPQSGTLDLASVSWFTGELMLNLNYWEGGYWYRMHCTTVLYCRIDAELELLRG